MAIKRDAFRKAGMLSVNAITEDTDLGLKLSEIGYKSQVSHYHVETYMPKSFFGFIKQKLRWGSGFIQCFLRHFKVYLKNPIFDFYIVLFFIPLIFSMIFDKSQTGIYESLFSIVIFPLFSLPYVLLGRPKLKNIFLVYPFALIYLPITSMIYSIAFFIGGYKYFKLKNKKIGWKGN
jgi:cellulose synthase/poly-beta-1,6-N-acetylglucosamine synthase-like glycosyltransferase